MIARIRRVLAPPVFEGDEEKTRNAALLNILLLVILGAIIVASYFQIADSDSLGTKITTAVVMMAVPCWSS